LGRDKAGKDTDHTSGKESSGKGASNKRFYPIYGIILLTIAFIIYIVLQNPEEPIVMLRRFAGAFAYLTMFLTIVSSEFMARMRKISGLPFIKTHHNLARIGILLNPDSPDDFCSGGAEHSNFFANFSDKSFHCTSRSSGFLPIPSGCRNCNIQKEIQKLAEGSLP
jgi:hypothetical protein